MADEFEPRRAEPDQEFSYTLATDDVTVSADKADADDFEAPGELISIDPESGRKTFRRFGVQRTLKADKEGVVHPKTSADVAVLDSFGLPVARSAKADDAPKAKEK